MFFEANDGDAINTPTIKTPLEFNDWPYHILKTIEIGDDGIDKEVMCAKICVISIARSCNFYYYISETAECKLGNFAFSDKDEDPLNITATTQYYARSDLG